VDTFPYLGSLVTEDDECTTEFRTRLNSEQAITGVGQGRPDLLFGGTYGQDSAREDCAYVRELEPEYK